MNNSVAIWSLHVQLKCELGKFAASSGRKRFTLQFAQRVVSALRPLFQDRNIDELMQHLSGCSPHCLVI